MRNRTFQLLIVIAASVLTLVATDILLPGLPQIAQYFVVSATKAKMLISIFMIGQFATVLFWGVIADQLGKRQALLLGMLLFLFGSVLSLFVDSINYLLWCRFLQGAGSVVVPVAGWALIQDLFPNDEGARIMAWVGTLGAVIPLFAPAIGGKIDVLYGWQTNLYCIAVFSLSLCLVMLSLRPKKEPASNSILTLKEKLSIYGHIIRNKTFISYIALFGLLNCGEWCFLTASPFYYAHKQIAPDNMGILLMITSTGFVFGSLLASYLFKRLGVDKTIGVAIQLALLSSVVLVVGEYLKWNSYPIFNAIDLGVYILSSALLWGGTTSRALQCFDGYRGSASAIRSLILLCFAALGTCSGQLVSHESLYQVGFFLLLMALLALIVFNNKEMKAERTAVAPAV